MFCTPSLLQASYISLRLTEDLAGFSKYLGFLKQKEPVSHHHMVNTISCTIKTLAFLSSTNRAAAPALIPPKVNWLESLKKQLAGEVAQQVKDSQTLLQEGVFQAPAMQGQFAWHQVQCQSTESQLSHCPADPIATRLPPRAGRWMQAHELLRFQERVTEEATMEWDTIIGDPASTHRQRATAARRMQEAAILNLLFGHYPPPRITCMITTVTTDYEGPCRCAFPWCPQAANVVRDAEKDV